MERVARDAVADRVVSLGPPCFKVPWPRRGNDAATSLLDWPGFGPAFFSGARRSPDSDRISSLFSPRSPSETAARRRKGRRDNRLGTCKHEPRSPRDGRCRRARGPALPAPAANRDFRFVNSSGQPLWELYVSPASDDTWNSDLLGRGVLDRAAPR